MNHNRNIFLAIGFILTITLACGSLTAPTTPTAMPTSTNMPPTATSVPLYQQVTVSTISFNDSGKSPDYTITAQIPALEGNSDPRAAAFTTAMHDLVQGLIDDFKKNLAQNPVTPVKAASYLDIKFSVVSPPGNILSVKYLVEGYLAGMAHPYHLNPTFNFDLESGKELSLADLFLSNVDYLTPISEYCVAELTRRDIGFTSDFAQGADPKPENYKNWNITADGLVITFDEYQVAPYVAGPQAVTIPYTELKSLIDPNGPLAQFIK